MSKDSEAAATTDLWARNLLIGILLALVGTGVTGIYSLGGLSENVSQLNGQMVEVTNELKTLVKEDLADMKMRLHAFEQRQILPEADERLDRLEEKVAEMSREMRVKGAVAN